MDEKDLLILEMFRLLGNAEGNLDGLKFYMQDEASRKRLLECKRILTNGADKAMAKFNELKRQDSYQIKVAPINKIKEL